MQCPTCKQVLDDSVRFCPHDGTPLVDTAATRADSTPTGGRRPPARELELPLTVGNRYRLEELRGGGGMAKVYRATDVTLERDVAVKLINTELRTEEEFDARFQREARIASQLADPHIVVVHDFGIDVTHGPYLVMEYLQGQSLRERLIESGPLPMKACLQLAGQLFLALIHAHGKGIVHRDIKPDNIFLLNQSGVRLHVRVLDFGIARIYRGDDGGTVPTLTHAGAVLGTPKYMSPEQLAGQTVDARSDLYSAALVIWESLTGQVPYLHGKKLTELCPDATAGLQELLEHCLKPAADERPLTAVEVYLRLQELGKASGILLLPPGAMDKLVAARKANEPTVAWVPKDEDRRRTRRRLLIGTGAVLGLLAALAVGKWWYDGRPPADPSAPCQLHDVKIGDSQATVETRLGVRGTYKGNPWNNAQTKGYLGNVLRAEDLRLRPEQVDAIETARTSNDKVSVLFHDGKVVALVTTQADARSARNATIGIGTDRVTRLYEGQPATIEPVPGGGGVSVSRYPGLGIGFEAKAGKVTGMALFPPVPVP